MKIGVVGAGSWGTALADLLAENGNEVTIWTNVKEQADEMNAHHTNERYLKNYTFNESIKTTVDLEDMYNNKLYLFVLPTKVTRMVVKNFMPIFESNVNKGNLPIIMHASKGLEQGTHERLTQVIEDEFKAYFGKNTGYSSINVLSGPSHAEEVALKDLTAVDIAGNNEDDLKEMQQLFSNKRFRVYTTTDALGVELSGSLKNVYAFASGVLSGLGYGDNARAALITRSLVEMKRFIQLRGGNAETIYGLAGVGDLIVTATSIYSRNWQAGNTLGKSVSNFAQKLTTKEIVDRMDMVVEGVYTAKVVHEVAEDHNLNMPIAEAVYQVIYEGADIHEAVKALMEREFCQE